MLNNKTKLITAVMGISIVGSTGIASVVQACPVNASPINTRSETIYRQYRESLTVQLDKMVSNGFINSYQELKVFDIFMHTKDFKSGLNNLVATGVISSYQALTILDAFNNSAQPNNSPNPKALELAHSPHLSYK